MPSSVEFREALRVHLGEEKFREFLKRGIRPGLRYWQEQALERFFQLQPRFRLPHDQVESALRFCEVHSVELQTGEVPVFHGNVDYAPAYLRERDERFPHAGVDPVSTEGVECDMTSEPVWFCSACRAVAMQRRHSAA